MVFFAYFEEDADDYVDRDDDDDDCAIFSWC